MNNIQLYFTFKTRHRPVFRAIIMATPHNSRLTPCAPSRRPLHTALVEKMLVDTQSSNCAFLLDIGAHCPVIRHPESCGAALGKYESYPQTYTQN
jgi:hypothetical protein